MKKSNYWEVKRKINALKNLSLSKAEPEMHYPLIKSAFSGVATSAITIKNKIIYRSRWNKDGKLFHNIKELRYPEADSVNQKGRLNNIGESILYAAACELGTIIESRPDINKLFTISSIEIHNQNLFFFPLGITDKGYYNNKLSSAEKLIINYVNSEIIKKIENNEEYNPTIALSHFYLKTRIQDVAESASIAYPSVESSKISNKTTFNFSILPCVFDKYFSITSATVYCLTNEETHIQLTPLNKTKNISITGDLEWEYTYQQMKGRITKGLSLDGKYYENLILLNL